MKPVECEFESETLAAVKQGRWPGRVDAELHAHVAGCGICSDIAAVAGAFEEAREELCAQAAIPDSGRMWWRAQFRARREAAEAAGRPITAAQAIALACAAGLFGACFGAVSTWFQSALRWVVAGVEAVDFPALLAAAAALLAEHAALVLGMAAVLLLLPAAVYLAIGRD